MLFKIGNITIPLIINFAIVKLLKTTIDDNILINELNIVVAKIKVNIVTLLSLYIFFLNN